MAAPAVEKFQGNIPGSSQQKQEASLFQPHFITPTSSFSKKILKNTNFPLDKPRLYVYNNEADFGGAEII